MEELIHELGEFHPAVVHFPIALWLVAALLELIATLKKDDVRFRFAATCNLHLAVAGAIVAVSLGWADAGWAGAWEPRSMLFPHRWLGTSTVLWGLLTLGLWARARQPGASPKAIWAYRCALWLGALLVGFAGHFGGMITHGD